MGFWKSVKKAGNWAAKNPGKVALGAAGVAAGVATGGIGIAVAGTAFGIPTAGTALGLGAAGAAVGNEIDKRIK